MTRYTALAFTALLTPVAAWAQVSYSQARIARAEPVLTPGELRTCMARDESIDERKARLESEQLDIDREADLIAREGLQLTDELQRLDSRDVAAVAAYNARSTEHNRRVDSHNRHVANVNGRAALLNGDSARLDALCARPFYPADRDAILAERARLR